MSHNKNPYNEDKFEEHEYVLDDDDLLEEEEEEDDLYDGKYYSK